jgi:hypothetical protein
MEKKTNAESRRKRNIKFITKFDSEEYAQFIALHSNVNIDRSALIRSSVLGDSQKIVTNVKGILDTLDKLGPAIAASGEAVARAAAELYNHEERLKTGTGQLEEWLSKHVSLQNQLEDHMRKLIRLMGKG